MVQGPTRWATNETCSALDYIFTNEEGLIEGLKTHAPLGESDDCFITFNGSINPFTTHQEPHPVRNYGRMNTEKLQQLLYNEDWGTLQYKTDVDQCWTHIRNAITRAVEATTLLFTPKARTNTDWL